MRFTKLNDAGTELPADATDHTQLRDNTTGLTWSASTLAERLNWKDAATAAAAVTIGGHSDWRLPTVQELFAIADHSRFNPAIDTDAFPNTKSNYYWSSTPDASSPAVYAWIVYFYGGDADYDHQSGTAFVRAVRSSSPASQ